MVNLRTSHSRPILNRGPAPGLRFFFFALLSFGLMWLDERQHYLEKARYGLSTVVYPLQLLVNSPGAAWDWMQESFTTRDRLQKENALLRIRLRDSNVRTMQFEALQQENERLREVRQATASIGGRTMIAHILRVGSNPLRHRVTINKGVRDGVFKGQPILDSKGVFGQITRVGPYSAEAILISDSEHAIPVHVNRNGLRTLAVGIGDYTKLSLPYLPTNADIKQGDLLVTSGLDGTFPSGYPVAIVTQIKKEVVQSLAEIWAQPTAALDRDREVVLVWPGPQEPGSQDISPPAKPEKKP